MSIKQLFKLADKFETKLNKFSEEKTQTVQANIESIQFLRGAAGKINNMLARITGDANSEFNQKFKPVLNFCNDLYRRAMSQSLNLPIAGVLKENILNAYQEYDLYLQSSFTFKQSKNYNEESANLLNRLHQNFLEKCNNYIPKAILAPKINPKFIKNLSEMIAFLPPGVTLSESSPEFKSILGKLVTLSNSEPLLRQMMFTSQKDTEMNTLISDVINKHPELFSQPGATSSKPMATRPSDKP